MLAAPGAVTIRAGDDIAKVEQARSLVMHVREPKAAAVREVAGGAFVQRTSKRASATNRKDR